jgi:NAD(P)-dependent dehydrogenase (short-subunit alcohol dehydrogenase family)
MRRKQKYPTHNDARRAYGIRDVDDSSDVYMTRDATHLKKRFVERLLNGFMSRSTLILRTCLRKTSISSIPYSRSSFFTMSSAVKAAQTTLSQNLGGTAHNLAAESRQFKLEETPDQTGKVAVITGGSEGIGYGCVHTLLTKNISKIFILSISENVIADSVQAIKEELGEELGDRMRWIQLDLSNWKQIPQVASQISNETNRIDILINNAARGIMTYQLTDQVVDRHMAVNHIGHVILTSHLLPKIKDTASKGSTVRISNQASNAHEQAPKDTKFASLEELNTDLGPMPLYGRAKLANILYSRYLHRHLHKENNNILINSTHPGVVDTAMSTRDIMEPYPRLGHLMKDVMSPFKKDQFEGCVSTVYAATAVEKSGMYICPPADPEPGSELARNDELGEQLMKLTREIVKEKTREELKDY